MPVWVREKLFMKRMLWEELARVHAGASALDAEQFDPSAALPKDSRPGRVLFHRASRVSHAASAYYAVAVRGGPRC